MLNPACQRLALAGRQVQHDKLRKSYNFYFFSSLISLEEKGASELTK
jgi:hypothetical protein